MQCSITHGETVSAEVMEGHVLWFKTKSKRIIVLSGVELVQVHFLVALFSL